MVYWEKTVTRDEDNDYWSDCECYGCNLIRENERLDNINIRILRHGFSVNLDSKILT